MDSIFHEKQQGALCAQHCLNALLQGPYYTAVDLANIAGQLDEEERKRMAGGVAGENSEEYRRFIAQPSANMDDTGFFSIQVIANAIGVWGLEIISYSSSDSRSVSARNNPTSQSAFICNYQLHWFSIRKLGNQWFNLNSLLTGPELISDTFLSLFLAQLETEGYTIYVVVGELPECTANQMLRLIPAVQNIPPKLISEGGQRGYTGELGIGMVGASSSSLAAADSGSMGVPSRPLPASTSTGSDSSSTIQDLEFQAAMAMSLADRGTSSISSEDDDLKLAMQLSKSLMKKSDVDVVIDQPDVISEGDELKKAVAMSVESKTLPKEISSNLGVQATVQQQQNSPKSKPAAPVPGPSEMSGQGHSLGGSTTSAAEASGLGSSTPSQRQSTPDPAEVRRRRLAFLEKQSQKEN